MSQRIRLDQMLVERGLSPSRARARDSILRGCISVDGIKVTKQGLRVSAQSRIEITDKAQNYVSRAALKLKAALEHFKLEVSGKTALDIGASTGGFTQVLLEAGAEHVIAVDVGSGQLVQLLRDNRRVTNMENLNARALSAEHLVGRTVNIVVSDVSFVSLTIALPPALHLAEAGAFAVLLVKPQFEVGKDNIGKGGLVRPEVDLEALLETMKDWLQSQKSWRVIGTMESPVKGGDGNREFLLVGCKDLA